MENKFAAFVGYATLVAYRRLDELSQKYGVTPSPDILVDAARYGQQSASERFFPGLVRLPFANSPMPEIIMALRYQYEADPDGMQVGKDDPSSRRNLADPSGTSVRYRIAGARLPQPQPDDTSMRARNGLSPTPLAQAVRSADDPSSKPAYPVVPEGESTRRDGTAAPNGSQTNLRRIGPAPLLPWEKKRNGQ
jgi:hypothetical protein